MEKPKAQEFPVGKARESLKKCPKIVKDYVTLLETTLGRQYQITAKAIAKMRELAAIEQMAREMEKNEPN